MAERSFTVDESNINSLKGGRYVSKTPSGAAKKAATQLFRQSDTKGSIKFMLRETTQGSAGKILCYVAKKVVLSPPKVVKIGDSEITYHFKYSVVSCKNPL